MNIFDPNHEDHLDIYVPGVLRCPQCSFELTKATLFVGLGEIGLTREQAYCKSEPCPNDGTPMVKVRWSERAQQNYEAYGALMNEIIGIAGLSIQCDSLPEALSTLRQHMARVEALHLPTLLYLKTHCPKIFGGYQVDLETLIKEQESK